MFGDVTFAYPFILTFLLLIPAIGYWYWKKRDIYSPSLSFSSLHIFGSAPRTLKEKLAHLPVG